MEEAYKEASHFIKADFFSRQYAFKRIFSKYEMPFCPKCNKLRRKPHT